MYQSSEAWATAQDAADPLGPYRAEFAHPVDDRGAAVVYLSGNSLGLMPHAVRDLMAQELADWSRLGVEGHQKAKTPWYSYHENFTQAGARLVGAEPGEVVLMNSLTTNLHLMMVSFYRPAGPRRKILIEDAAFPSDTYAVASHLETRGIDPADGMVQLKPDPGQACLTTEGIEQAIAALGDELALVLLPGIQYYTGQRLDVARIAAAAHRVGAIAGFDLAHAVGNVPLQLHDWNVDFAAWCSYKYLNGGPGAPGGCFVHARHGANASLPRLAGWWGNDPATRFRLHLNDRFVPAPGGAGWQLSNPSVLAMTPLLASMAQFDRAGMVALRQKSLRLTGYLEFLLRRVPSGRLAILTPADPEARGCQLSVLIPERAKAVFDAVRARGILPDFRQPDVIRMSPVPLYNSFHDVWRAGTAMLEVLGA